MIFKITCKNIQYEYEIGESENAKQACESFNRYTLDQNYEDLKLTFSNLHWSVDRDAPYKRNACLAAECFALNVIPTLQSSYEKFFVTNSVTSIFLYANESIRDVWEFSQSLLAAELQRSGLNIEEAQKAGLLVFQA
jgi:hypothetical protein